MKFKIYLKLNYQITGNVIRQQQQIVDLVKLILNQNYFKINGTYWQQKAGTFMANLISSIVAEILSQERQKKFDPTITRNRHVRTALRVSILY